MNAQWLITDRALCGTLLGLIFSPGGATRKDFAD